MGEEISFKMFVERARIRDRHWPSTKGWRISMGRVFRRNGAANENDRFPVSSLTYGLERVMNAVERIDLWLACMVMNLRERAVVF